MNVLKHCAIGYNGAIQHTNILLQQHTFIAIQYYLLDLCSTTIITISSNGRYCISTSDSRISKNRCRNVFICHMDRTIPYNSNTQPFYHSCCMACSNCSKLETSCSVFGLAYLISHAGNHNNCLSSLDLFLLILLSLVEMQYLPFQLMAIIVVLSL